jgi:two-component system chemotaxis response regulator CheB
MPGHDIIVVGASAGGVETLKHLIRELPADLPAAVFVVLHLPAHSPSALPAILRRRGHLPVDHARDGEPIYPGRVYVAPPDEHLLLGHDLVRLVHGPRENGHRPAVDALFRSAARAYGPRVIGVVLSGMLDDGTAGLLAIKQRGGTSVVQDPDEAIYDGMPRSAIENVPVDYVVPVAEMAGTLVQLAHEPVEEGALAVSDEMKQETEIAALDLAAVETDHHPGKVSVFTCPECHGTLWELTEGDLLRFRCRVGHAFSADSLLSEQSKALEEALWTAFRALEESASLADRVVHRLKKRGNAAGVQRFERQAQDARQRAALIRDVLLRGQIDAPESPTAPGPTAGPEAPGPTG